MIIYLSSLSIYNKQTSNNDVDLKHYIGMNQATVATRKIITVRQNSSIYDLEIEGKKEN